MASAVQRKINTGYDSILLISTLLLVGIGLVFIFDASYAFNLSTGLAGYASMLKQLGWVIIGLICMLFFMMRSDYTFLRNSAWPLLYITLFMLAAVWFPIIGQGHKGASRWIGIGSVQFQPSEIAKLAIILNFAAYYSRTLPKNRIAAKGLCIPLICLVACCFLVEREPDLGTAIILFVIGYCLMIFTGIHVKKLSLVLITACVGFGLLSFAFGHRSGRLETFFNPQKDTTGKGYQMNRSLLAIGSGKMYGVGLGAGREKYYLPEPYTDFIFATVAEETGLCGSLFVVTLLFVVSWRAFSISGSTRDPFGRLLASGIGVMISSQALLNMLVVTGMLPATGVPLPFISYGGSSIVTLLISVGVLLNIARNPNLSRLS